MEESKPMKDSIEVQRYSTREFLNADNKTLTAFICATCNFTIFKNHTVSMDSSVKIADCNDQIYLEFDVDSYKTSEMTVAERIDYLTEKVDKRIRKVDVMLTHLQDLRKAMVDGRDQTIKILESLKDKKDD